MKTKRQMMIGKLSNIVKKAKDNNEETIEWKLDDVERLLSYIMTNKPEAVEK